MWLSLLTKACWSLTPILPISWSVSRHWAAFWSVPAAWRRAAAGLRPGRCCGRGMCPSCPPRRREKRRILQRLKEYRAANGPGCLEEVSQRTRTRGGVLSVMTLRDVLNGDAVLPVQDWRRIGRALDKLAPPEVPPGE